MIEGLWSLAWFCIGVVVGMVATLAAVGICSGSARADYELEIKTLRDQLGKT